MSSDIECWVYVKRAISGVTGSSIGQKRSNPLDVNGRTIWIADAHGVYGARLLCTLVKLTALLELQLALYVDLSTEHADQTLMA